MCRLHLDAYDHLTAKIAELDALVAEAAAPFAAPVARLETIPGIGRRTADASSPSRVAAAHFRAGAPSEPCVRLLDAHGSSKPRGRCGWGAGILRLRAWSSRRQEVCIKRVRFPSGVPCPSWWTRYSAAIALRATLSHQRSHSRGDWAAGRG